MPIYVLATTHHGLFLPLDRRRMRFFQRDHGINSDGLAKIAFGAAQLVKAV